MDFTTTAPRRRRRPGNTPSPQRCLVIASAAKLSILRGTNEQPAHDHGLESTILKTLLIVFHSTTGGTRQMAEAAAAVIEPCVTIKLLHAAAAHPADILAADGYIFATPENLAAISGLMKDFFDRCYYPALDRLQGRPYASMICAGSDGENAARQIARIATGWRLRAIAEPLIIRTNAQTPETILAPKTIAPADLARCATLAQSLAAGLAMGIF